MNFMLNLRSCSMNKFFKEFPNIAIDYNFTTSLAQSVIDKKLWQNIRKLKRTDNFNFDFSEIESKEDTDKAKRREYLRRVVFAYKLSEDDKLRAGVYADEAWLFKTNIDTQVYIHRESRSTALNFPLLFEPGKSYVNFYDDDCNQLERHILLKQCPVYFNVEQWHSVTNESLTVPRIVMTCSGLNGKWEDLLK